MATGRKIHVIEKDSGPDRTLIGRELATGRLVRPLAAPAWRAPDYTLVCNADRAEDNAVQAFEQWITAIAGQTLTPPGTSPADRSGSAVPARSA